MKKKVEREPSPDPWPCIIKSLSESIGDLKKMGEPECRVCAPNPCVMKEKKPECKVCAPHPCVMASEKEKVPVKVSRSKSVESSCRHKASSTTVSRSVTFEFIINIIIIVIVIIIIIVIVIVIDHQLEIIMIMIMNTVHYCTGDPGQCLP